MKGSRAKAAQRTRSTRKILLVADADGRIAALGGSAESGGKGPFATLRPLPGQTLHEVPLPSELEKHFKGSAADLHRALSEYQLHSGPAQSLLFRKVQTVASGRGGRSKRR